MSLQKSLTIDSLQDRLYKISPVLFVVSPDHRNTTVSIEEWLHCTGHANITFF